VALRVARRGRGVIADGCSVEEDDMRDELQAHLDAFDSLRPAGGFAYRRAATFGTPGTGRHVVFGSMVHGNEVGSLPAVVRIMRELTEGTRSVAGAVTFFVGNPEAGLQDARFLESDLNRVFVDEPPDTHEGRRARELKPILDAADVFVDLHQTILATTQPFYIAPFHMGGWHWARAIAGARVWITRHPGQAFSSGTCCADEYVRLQGKPGITLELSEKGFGHGAEDRAYAAITRALELSVAAADEAGIRALADEADELAFFHTVHREKFASEALALADGWINFQEVREGQVISAEGTPELVAPTSGMVLFPKYPPRIDGNYKKPLPGEIYRIVCPLDAHPTELYADAL
jgi:succinylglutamate desuccinylase